MRKRVTLIVIWLCVQFIGISQCPNAPVTLSSQAQVDNFPIAYPGCTNMTVLLTVTGADITNLDGLNGILTTTNSLILRDNPVLASLSGLSNLSSIAVELKIENNDALTSLSGLDNLNWLGGHLSIEGNALLQTLGGLGPIPSLGSYLNISFNPVLTDITALSSLTEVGPNYFNGFLAINNNNSLPAVNGLDLISATGSYFFLGSNPSMTTINGLNGLTTVNGDFEIVGNPLLTNLNAFASLTTINGSYNIDNNPVLGDIDEFNNLTNVSGILTIATNASLSNCAAQGICDYLSGPGQAIIANNTTGCNSVAQVETACSLLPVELIAFDAKPDHDDVMLQWQTASEKNNAFFEIEHKAVGGQSFKPIVRINGKGNSNTRASYEFLHKKPPKGGNYYRLRQVDYDGKSEYSDIVSVYVWNADEPDIFPNPTTGPVLLKGDFAGRMVRVTDLAGREVLAKNMDESSVIDLSEQPHGVYLIEIQTDREKVVKRILKN